MLSELNRRTMLALTGASFALSAARGATARPSAPLLDAYLATRGFRGKTAFWIARGARYAQVGTRLIPFQRSAVIGAVRFDQKGGVLTSSTLEGSLSFNMQDELSGAVVNPLTQAPLPIKQGSALIVDFQYQADGALSLSPSSEMRGAVRGNLTRERGEGARNITEVFEGFATPSFVGEPALSEIIVYRPDAASSSPRGFLRASKTVMVVRTWPYPAPDGVSARLFTLYEGRKFSTVDALVADAGAAQVRTVYPDLIERLRAF